VLREVRIYVELFQGGYKIKKKLNMIIRPGAFGPPGRIGLGVKISHGPGSAKG